jgi:hypothetical protein
MSTTFAVYSRSRDFPTFQELLDRSTNELHGFLASVGISARPQVHLQNAIFSAAVPVLRAIDALLIRHWWNLGLITMPPDHDLAVVDLKTGAHQPLEKPRR